MRRFDELRAFGIILAILCFIALLWNGAQDAGEPAGVPFAPPPVLTA